ncbi:MAG TPA: hypothetical protein VIG71_10790 [Enteractinococcus sp.]
MAGVRLLADKGTTAWLIEKPADPSKAVSTEINAGQDISCVVAADFNIGAGAPQTTDDGALCEGANRQVPTAATHEATINAIRFYDPETRQVHVEDDFFFQAVKEFGTEFWVAVRDGGKDPREFPDAVEGDEVSIYKLISGGAGRAADRAGYQKRQIHVTVSDAYEDLWVDEAAPVPTTAP